ncbi:hypothetical protein M1316_00475, partial [Candidatus Parvarchaeota archaeon]|nr:hypothetical protein [Candidatus Parvarchaeota archaeon]
GKSFLEILKKSLEDVVEHEAVQKFEIELATSNVSDDIPQEIKKVILDYLDPYKSDLSDFKTIHAIFLGSKKSLTSTTSIKFSNSLTARIPIPSPKSTWFSTNTY